MKFDCPHCSQNIEAPDEFAGSDAICPTCEGSIRVPQNEASEKPQGGNQKPNKKLPTLSEDALQKKRKREEDVNNRMGKAHKDIQRLQQRKRDRHQAREEEGDLGGCSAIFYLLFAALTIYTLMIITYPELRPDFVSSSIEESERKSKEEWKDEVSSRYSLWENRDIISVEIIKPEKMQFGAAPTRRGLRPVVLFPTEHKTKYRVTYTTSYGTTRTDTIDYDPSHYGK